MTSVLPGFRIDWRGLLARWDDLLLWVGMLAFFLYMGAHLPEIVESRGAQSRVAELARGAAREGLTYEAVRRDPGAARGRVVFWPVTHPGDLWFVDDDRARPIVWVGTEPDMETTGQSGGSRGEKLAAVVLGADARGVLLSYQASYSDSSGRRRKTSRNWTPESPSAFSTAFE